jgi:flagellin-like protein
MTKSRRAVSPVIATVVLVAVAITIAVAVSYWMSGISSQYTQFEKIEMTSAYCESDASTGGVGVSEACWNVTVDFRNTGTTESAIIGVSINGKAADDYGYNSTGTGAVWNDDNIRVYNSTWTQIDFADADDADQEIKYTVKPGTTGQLVISILQEPSPASAYEFSSGTTIEVSLRSAAGNTYMKMITLS